MERSVSSPDGIEAGKGITACPFGKNRRSPMKINISNVKKLFGKLKKTLPQVPKTEKEELMEAEEAAKRECRFNLNEDMRAQYANFLENSEIQENCILYEAFGGRGMTCSPHAIFKYLLTQADFQDFVHVWVIDDFDDNSGQIARYRNYENVKFIRYQSLEYRRYLATAKYLVNNVSFPGYFTKREGQVYVNTWHGIPLKTIGFDIPTGNVSAGNSAKNLLSADYLISPDAFMTEIYKHAFKLEGLYEGTILEVGQPRNDSYFHTRREDILKKLSESGVEIDPEKKLILYAPTWKGSRYASPDTSLEAYYRLIHTIEENVDTKKYQILVKPHQIVYYHIKKTQGITGQFIPATVDTNELLSVTDVLISDYSSIYFDYLVSKKPILFFIPDLDEYLGYRGLYFGIDKLPGPIAKSYEELAALVKNPEKAMEPHREKYCQEAEWACPKDDGNVCARLTDAAFRGKACEQAVRCSGSGKASEAAVKYNGTDKKKVLLYAGDFTEGDVTFSSMALLEYLDYEKYDVTLLAGGDGDDEAELRICNLPKAIRVLYRGQPVNAVPQEKALYEMSLKKGDHSTSSELEDFYKREIRRLFGESHFDYAVDLTGKDGLFSRMVSCMENTKVCRFDKRMVDTWRIREELSGQSVIVSEKDSYYLARVEREGVTVLEAETIAPPDIEETSYVCMGGRDYRKVLTSFAEVLKKNKKARLYIPGGKKAVKKAEKTVEELHLEGAVCFPGNLQKPFGFLKMCDYYVCAPGQEENELSVLEAKALGMELLREDCATKMEYEFDAEAYNREVCREFESLLGM